MKRLLTAVAGLLLVAAAGPAYATWTGAALGGGSVRLTAVDRASAPSAVPAAGRLALSWAAVTTESGAPVTGYDVVRHVGATTITVCSVPAPVQTCGDTSPVAGPAAYGVVARLASWRGPESPLTTSSYDRTAPTTTLSSDASLNAAGWSTRPVTVGLTATDSGSGVRSLTRQVNDDTPVTTDGGTASATLAAEGTSTLTYAATDNAGNVETTQSYTVAVDSVAPVTAATTDTAPSAAGWYSTSPVVLTLTPADATSGVSALRWRSGTAGTWTTATSWPVQLPQTVASGSTGTSTVQYQATDVAGNLEAIQTSTVKIDRSAPAAPTGLALSSDTGAVATDAITNTAVQSLKGSAEAGASLEVRVDGTLAGTGTVDAAGSFTVPMGTLTAGTHTVTATAVDVAGNRSAAASLTVRLDQTAPTAGITFPGATTYTSTGYRAGCGTSTTYDVCGTAADPASAYSSGVRSVQLEIRTGTTCLTSSGTLTSAGCATRLTASGTTSWTWTTPLLGTGSYTLTVWVTDLAGNTTQLSVAFVRS